MYHSMVAQTIQLLSIMRAMKAHDLAENAPTAWQPTYCATPDCGRTADIWIDERAGVALCGRCHAASLEVQP